MESTKAQQQRAHIGSKINRGHKHNKDESIKFPSDYTSTNQKHADNMGMNSVNLTTI